MLVEILLVVAVLLLLVKFGYFKTRTNLLLEKIPGPPAYPIIGSLLQFDYPKVGKFCMIFFLKITRNQESQFKYNLF